MNTLIINKNLYKMFLGIIKYIPTVLAILKIAGLILSKFQITSFFLTCIGGTSVAFLIILYLMSYLFNFCGTHRISLHYVTTVYLLSVIDWYIGLPITSIDSYKFYIIITGLFIILWIITWYKNRNNPKIDHLKHLCDNYTDCDCK